MATTLKSIVAFSGIGSGATAVLPHNLNIDGVGQVPDTAARDNLNFVITAVDDTNVTVRNDGAEGDCNVLVEHWYSSERVFGASSTTALTPQPFVPGAAAGDPPLTGTFPLTGNDNELTTNVYVDGVNGDDGNDGLTPSTALATIEAVYKKFPWQLLGLTRLIVNLLNPTSSQITYTQTTLWVGGGNMPLVNTYVYRGPAMVQFTPATGPATAALDATPAVRVDQTGAPSGSGNRTQLDFSTAAPGWTVRDLAGSFVRITRGGTLLFHELPIAENGTDFIIVDTLGIVGTLLATDTVEIVEPAVKIVGSSDPSNFSVTNIVGRSAADPEAGFVDPVNNGATFERITFGTIYCAGGWGMQFDRCQAKGGSFGWNFTGGSVNFVNHAQVDEGIRLNGNSADLPVPRDDAAGVPIDTTPRVCLTIAGGPAFRGGLALGNRIFLFPRGAPSFTANQPVSVYESTDNGIDVRGPGASFIMGTTAESTLNGSGNDDVGVRCKLGGLARINGGSASTITGLVNDLRIGEGTAATISYGTGVGEFEEAAGYDGNFQNFPVGTTPGGTGDQSRITTEDPQEN